MFDLAGAYTVTFDSATVTDRLIVRDGSVTFALDGLTYSVTSTDEMSVTVSNDSGGTPTLSLANGVLAAVSSEIAGTPGSSGHVVVGAGAVWTNSGNLRVGGGTGSLVVIDGGQLDVSQTLMVPQGGTVTLDGGILNSSSLSVNGGALNLNSGTLALAGGQLSATAGGQIDGAHDVDGGSSVNVLGGGSTWSTVSAIRVGGNGQGEVFVSQGGAVSNTTARIGFDVGSQGSVIVDGPGSTWTSSDGIEVGSEQGFGVLNVFNGAQVDTTFLSIGEFGDASGEVLISGMGASISYSTKLEVGVFGEGSLRILAGGSLTVPGLFGNPASIAREAGSVGAVVVDGTGSTWTAGDGLKVGDRGEGSMQITAGGQVTSGGGVIGSRAGSQGEAVVDGIQSVWTSAGNGLLVGWFGTGSLSVSGGARVETTGIAIGLAPSGKGIATVSDPGSTLQANGLDLGSQGTGELHVLNGASVSIGSGQVGQYTNSHGVLEIKGNGSTLESSGSFLVGGQGGAGTVDINTGGHLSVGTVLSIRPLGVVNVDAGTLSFATLEMLGGALNQPTTNIDSRVLTGHGTINGIVTGSGAVIAQFGHLMIGDASSPAGVSVTGSLTVKSNSTLTLLSADAVHLGATTTLANFGQLSAPNGLVLDSGRILTAGAAQIAGAMTNLGVVNGPVSGLLTFEDDVDGNGLHTGNIRFASKFSPGDSPATVSVAGNVTFASTAELRLELGGVATGQLDQVAIAGSATLAGTLAVDLIDGYQPALGNTHTVLTFLTRAGEFQQYAGLTLDGNLALRPVFTLNSLVLATRPALDGDINLDGVVDIFDVNSVSDHWGTSGPQGDVNGDGIVDVFDVNMISDNWGATGRVGGAAVPEPCSLILIATAIVHVIVLKSHLTCGKPAEKALLRLRGNSDR